MELAATMLCSSLAYYFSTGVYNNWLLTWLAPLPLLVYTLRASTRCSALAAFVVCFAGFSNVVFAYAQTIIPVSFLVYGNLISAVAFTSLVMLFRYLALRKAHWIGSFLLASGWTAFEWIVAQYSKAGTIDSIAYTQVFNLPLLQIASITGIWGISFLLLLVPSGLALAWHYRKNRKICLQASLIPLCILLLTLLFGICRLSVANQGPTVKIGMASIPVKVEDLLSRKQPQRADEMISQYIACVERLARSGVKLVVLPEKIAGLNLNERAQVLDVFAAAARQYQVALIAALDVEQDGRFYNTAYLFLPSGGNALRYDKQHLLPFSEGKYTAGEKLGVSVQKDGGVWGVAICKDMDFPEPSRAYGQAGTQLLLVPALDFKTDALLHARVAIVRGVEYNYAVARAGQWGLLSLSDNKGRMLKMMESSGDEEAVLLVGEVQLGQGQSLYSCWGDWFAYFSAGLFVALLVFFLQLKKENGEVE